jgi:hypothetical protein
VLWWIGGGLANADTVTIDAYRARLREARGLVLAARSAFAKPQQPALLAQAAALLRGTDTLRLTDGSTIAIDDTGQA